MLPGVAVPTPPSTDLWRSVIGRARPTPPEPGVEVEFAIPVKTAGPLPPALVLASRLLLYSCPPAVDPGVEGAPIGMGVCAADFGSMLSELDRPWVFCVEGETRRDAEREFAAK